MGTVMGYLQIPSTTLPNFSKGVISVFFRIPGVTLEAVSALSDDPGGDVQGDGWEGACFSPPLYKIIPLITFGSLETGLGDAAGVSVQPSFIGVDCSFAGTDDGHGNLYKPSLSVNLQTPITCSFNKTPTFPERELRAECYYMGGAGSRAPSFTDFQQLEVTPDVWHHALISFDISPTCSVTFSNANRPVENVISPGPTFSWAFDDVVMVGPSMQPAGGGVAAPLADPIDDRFIIPQGLLSIVVSGDFTATPIEDSTDFVVTVADSAIASSGNPIGIPTSAAFVDNVHNIELAELQVFTGVTLDTTVQNNRRAFIKADGSPEITYSIADGLLGKSPEVRLSGDSLWKAGINAGTIGNFVKVGTINSFSPGPLPRP